MRKYLRKFESIKVPLTRSSYQIRMQGKCFVQPYMKVLMGKKKCSFQTKYESITGAVVPSLYG